MSALLAEFDVLADHRVVLLQHESVGIVATVLARHVGVTGAGGGAELDDRANVLLLRHQIFSPRAMISPTTASMPRASITLMPLADTFRVTLRFSDGTKYVFFWMFTSNRRLLRRCECEMVLPKPGPAPVTWHTAATVPPPTVSGRGDAGPPKITCLRAVRVESAHCRDAAEGKAYTTAARDPSPLQRARGAPLAGAEDVDDVLRIAEAVACGDVRRPLLDRVRLDLDGPAAGPADQVVVVPGRDAGAVEVLAVTRLQRVGVAVDGEGRERAVHGRKPDGGAGLPQGRVELLRADEAVPGPERLADGGALPGPALHGRKPTSTVDPGLEVVAGRASRTGNSCARRPDPRRPTSRHTR